MSHSLDFIGLNERLFVLRHFIAGNKEYSRRARNYRGIRTDVFEDWVNYARRLRYHVSNDLIDMAAKLRVIQDTAMEQVSAEIIRELDISCMDGKSLGSVLTGEFDLTLRESCNKIIHATSFSLTFRDARNTQPPYQYSYWNGICRLEGSRGKRLWRMELDVYKWADAIDWFLEELSGNVDW